jgi:hypothetical protein
MPNNNEIILNGVDHDNNPIYLNVDEIIKMPYSKKCKELYVEYTTLIWEYYRLRGENNMTNWAYKPSEKLKQENRDRMDDIIDLVPGYVWRHKEIFGNRKSDYIDIWEKRCCDIIEACDDSITPISPGIMINISPERPPEGMEGIPISSFGEVIETYAKEMNSSRYSKCSYVIENGKDGKNIHAHCVFIINPKMINSVLNGKNSKGKPTSHIGKSNHLRQIRHHWSKIMPEGIGGLKLNIQCSILRVENLIEDKLKYLEFDSKPLGHENLSQLMETKHLSFD